ncbi:MAG: hypothetical protein HA491_05300 [Candidatus Verstraetearchaeota archaeon]|nr:hypothetical protein [Candidatus Verstraetearchaeota archaeon]
MLEELVELGEKGLSRQEVDARNFRAKLLGLFYEDLLKVWFEHTGYKVIGKDMRKGLYKGRPTAVDFILEKDGRLYVVEAKCWPAYDGGRWKKLTSGNAGWIKRRLRAPFFEEDFVEEYRIDGRRVDGKILVWWDFEGAETDRIKSELKLDGLVSLRRVLSELRGDPKAEEIVRERKSWADQLFGALLK